MSQQVDIFEDVSNPLDSVEEILSANDWTFDRMNEDELTVHVSGKMGHYKMMFHWQEEFSAMQFYCLFDLDIRGDALDLAAKTMSSINSDLWLGHFDLRRNTATPCFRHTSLFRGMTQTSGADHLEDLVDIALSECERYYPVFDMLSKGLPARQADLKLALMDVAGQS